MSSLRVLQEGTRVVVLKDGALAADLTWEAALEVGKALVSVGKKAEEWAKALEIARDAAILLRAGVPVGLTNHPAIRKEAKHIAETDDALRRYMPGIKSQEMFGTPAILQH